MSKSPEKPLHREHEALNCWECDKKYTKSGRGCERPYRRSMKRRGQRRFERELDEVLMEVEESSYIRYEDEYSSSDKENWLAYKLDLAVEAGWFDED